MELPRPVLAVLSIKIIENIPRYPEKMDVGNCCQKYDYVKWNAESFYSDVIVVWTF